jgi:hypothetical protein
MGLEQGPLSLVTITEELLEWKSSGSGSRKPRLTVALITGHPLFALTSPTSGGRSVSIFRLWTKAKEFSYFSVLVKKTTGEWRSVVEEIIKKIGSCKTLQLVLAMKLVQRTSCNRSCYSLTKGVIMTCLTVMYLFIHTWEYRQWNLADYECSSSDRVTYISQPTLRNKSHKQAGTCIVKDRLALLNSVTGEMKSVSSIDSTISSSSRASSVYRFCLYSTPTKKRFKMKTKQRRKIRKSALCWYLSPMEDVSWNFLLCIIMHSTSADYEQFR